MGVLIPITEETNRQGTNDPFISKLYGIPFINKIRENGAKSTIILDGKRYDEERIVSESKSTIDALVNSGYLDFMFNLTVKNVSGSLNDDYPYSISLTASQIVEVYEDSETPSDSIVRYRDDSKQEDTLYTVDEDLAAITALMPSIGGGGGGDGIFGGSGIVPAGTTAIMSDGNMDFEYIANDSLNITLTNTNAGISAKSQFVAVSDAGVFSMTKNSNASLSDAGDSIMSTTGGDMIFNQGTSNRDFFWRISGSTAFAMHGLSGFMGIGIGETTPTEKLEIGGNMLVSGVYKVGTNKVVGARISGWSTASGTASRTSFDTSTVTTEQLAERVKALIDDLDSASGHGLIGS